MKVRCMRKEDVEQVASIEQVLFSKPWSKKDFLDALSKEENIYLVAEEQEKILGYCGVWGVAGEGQITNVSGRITRAEALQLHYSLIYLKKAVVNNYMLTH